MLGGLATRSLRSSEPAPRPHRAPVLRALLRMRMRCEQETCSVCCWLCLCGVKIEQPAHKLQGKTQPLCYCGELTAFVLELLCRMNGAAGFSIWPFVLRVLVLCCCLCDIFSPPPQICFIDAVKTRRQETECLPRVFSDLFSRSNLSSYPEQRWTTKWSLCQKFHETRLQ